MSKNFTHYAFTNSVKKAQGRYGTRDAYARMEQAGDRYRRTAREALFIQSRDSFYMATVGENGWPYVQFRGGEKGFLKVIDDTTIVEEALGRPAADFKTYVQKTPHSGVWATDMRKEPK